MKKRKQKVQIFKLEERVLFDGAAAAEIVAAVNNAGDANNADQADDSDSDQDHQHEKFIQNTVQNAGPVDMPVPDATVQNDGEGIPQADAAQNDPAEALVNGNADHAQPVDVNADAHDGADAADTLQVSADADADADSDAFAEADLIVIDHDAADQLDLDVLDGRNVLVLDGDTDVADQIENWLSDHADQDVDHILLVSDSDSQQDIQFDHIELDTLSIDDFQSALDQNVTDDIVIMPDNDSVFTVDSGSGDMLSKLAEDAEEDRHELVIVNSSTADLDNVLDQLGDSREILVIDSSSDVSGLDQVENYLADHDDVQYDAVHILTHGNDEGFYLGHDKVIDADQMTVFDGHMADHGDFMLYGCNLASTDRGQAFIHDIADVTGCDVAASTDMTGAESMDANWTLEYSSGAIETTSISLDSSWDHRLVTIVVDGTLDKETATQASTLARALNGGDYPDGEGTKHRDAAKAGDIIELKKDVAGANFGVGGITLTAGNYSISGNFSVAGTEVQKITFSGGIFTGTVTVDGYLSASGAQLGNVVNNGTIIGTAKSEGGQLSGNGDWGTESSSFTLNASSGTVTITGAADFTQATLNLSKTADLNINQAFNGTFKDSAISDSGTGGVAIHNGTFEDSSITSTGDGDLTINTAANDDASFQDSTISISKGSLTIAEGDFDLTKTGTEVMINVSGKADATISGGTFTGYEQHATGFSFAGSGTMKIDGATTGAGPTFRDFEKGVVFSGSTNDGSITAGTFSGNIYGITHSGSKTLTIDESDGDDVFINNNVNDSNSAGAGILVTSTGALEVDGIEDMNGNYRGIQVDGNAAKGTDTSITNLSIINSVDSGIYNTGTINHIQNVTLDGNGDASKTLGGGIYNSGKIAVIETNHPTGTFDNVTITNNNAKSGGGIYNTGSIAYTKYDPTEPGTDPSFTNVTITGNTAGSDGGGIYNSGTIAMAQVGSMWYNGGNLGFAGNVKVANNTANRGGGVYWSSGRMATDMFVLDTVAGSGFEGNYATYGGGMYVVSGAGGGKALLKDLTFKANAANAGFKSGDDFFSGGALYVGSGAEVSLLNVTFDGNFAADIDLPSASYDQYMYGVATGNVDAVVTNNGGRGGAVYNAGTLTVMTSEFDSNFAVNANDRQFPNYALYLQTLSMGGAIYNAGTLSMTDSWIHDNIAVNGLGGGVYNAQGATATLSSSEPYTGQHWIPGEPQHSNSMIVEGNLAFSSSDGTQYAGGGFGGGIYADSGSTLTLNSVTVRNNVASLTVQQDGGATTYDIGRGGGIYFGEANVYVDALQTRPSLGSGTLTIDGTIRNAIYQQYPAQYERMRRASDISGNIAAVGAGMFTDTAGTVTIHNTEIHGNTVPGGELFTSAEAAKEFYSIFWVTSEQSEYARTQQHSAPENDALEAVGQMFRTSGVGMYATGSGATVTLSNSQVGETDIAGVKIYDNVGAESLGGGLYVSTNPYQGSRTVNVTLTDAEIYDNTAKMGGGVYQQSGNLKMTDDFTPDYLSSIHGNEADFGAGVYQAGGSLTLENLSIYGNTLTSESGTGAALYLHGLKDGGTASLYNVTVADHSASKADAAAIYNAGITLSIYNSTIGLNDTVGIQNAYGTLALYNTLVVGNGGDGFTNVVGDYTDDGHSLVGTSQNKYSAKLIFGNNAFDPSTGVIVLDQNSGNPALAGGALYADPDGEYFDQLGNDRREKPGDGVYSVGAVAGNGFAPLPPPSGYLVVNTFFEDSNPDDAVVSLREAIMYLQSEYNTDRSISVTFDYVALAQEAGGYDAGNWVFQLEDSFGVLQFNGSNDAGIREISIDGGFMDASGREQVMTVNGLGLTASIFSVVGMKVALSNLTVLGPANAGSADGSVAHVTGKNGEFSLNGKVTVQGGHTTGDGTIYVADGGKVSAEGTGNTIRNNTAANGAAVYAAKDGSAVLDGITIDGNRAQVAAYPGFASGDVITSADGETTYSYRTAVADGVPADGWYSEPAAEFASGDVTTFYSRTYTYKTRAADHVADGWYDMNDKPLAGVVSGDQITVGATTYTYKTMASDRVADGWYEGFVAMDPATDLTGYSIEKDGNVYVNDGVAFVRGGSGGGIYAAEGSTVSVTDGVISNGTAVVGGGIYAEADTTVTLTNSTLTGNTATLDGGAVYNAGDFTMTGRLIGSTATAGNGGAVYNTGSFTLTGDISNSTAGADGGAVYNTGSFTQEGNISNSNAGGSGGAVYNTGSFTLTGNISNSTAGADGGAVYTAGSFTQEGNISGSTAAGRGGALFVEGGTVTVLGDITGGSAAEGSVVYLESGRVDIGDLDHYIKLTGNTGNIVTIEDGELFLANALVKGNGTDGSTLFTVNAGSRLTVLNSTVTGNSGDILDNSGTVQIGDSTIAFNADTALITNHRTLNIINSIVNVAKNFTLTHNVHSLINQKVENIFVLNEGQPVTDKNGTLRISPTGPAFLDGVMVGYKTENGETTLYYTEDGKTWHTADGASVKVSGLTKVAMSQNESDRLYSKDYGLLSIGAYSLAGSLVVTISSDTPKDGETTLREAIEYSSYLYTATGEVQTVTFKVKEANLDSTITVNAPVNIKGNGVTISASGKFTGDTLLTVKDDTSLSGVALVGAKGVRGITLQSGDLSLNNVTIRDASVSGKGGAIYAVNGSISGSDVRLVDNTAKDGAAIYSKNAAVSLNGFKLTGNTATAGSVITSQRSSSGSETALSLRNGTISGNDSTSELISANGTAALIQVTATNNKSGDELLTANSADIVNSSLTGNPQNGGPLVSVTQDLNVANSVITTSDSSTTSAKAGSLKSAYSIYSGSPNFAENVENETGYSTGRVFSGTNSNGQLVVAEGSPAAAGVWTQYDPQTRAVSYSVRPDEFWTKSYSPDAMEWRYLGGGSASYNPALLVGSPDYPSMGSYRLASGTNHPDYGPGVNSGMVDPSFNGGFGTDWGYNSVVNSYLMDPQSSLTLDSGMGWYSAMLADLFGYRLSPSGSILVRGGVQGEELDLSVDGVQEDFNEFQEAPYRADDGSPLSPEEQADLLKSITLNRRPEDTLNLSETVHEQVASSLRSAELFKDSFDKALESLLGQDA